MTRHPSEQHIHIDHIVNEALAARFGDKEISPSLLRVARSAAAVTAAHTMPILNAARHEWDIAVEESMRDRMTGLDNRRGFDESLRRALAFAWDHNVSVSAVFMYFDNLKEINDTKGHKAGDNAIIDAAHSLQQYSQMDNPKKQLGCQLRGPARFESGDDFGVLMLGPREYAEDWWKNMQAVFLDEGIVMRVGIGSCHPMHAGFEPNALVETTYNALLLARSQGELSSGGIV